VSQTAPDRQGAPAWLAEDAAASVCYLTTTGRRTGRDHEIEIWFALHDGRLYLLAGGRDRSDWVRNVMAGPGVRVRLRGRSLAGTARVVAAPAEDALARRLLAAKYQGWREGRPLSDWARTALPVVVTFGPPPSADGQPPHHRPAGDGR
jgi:deazaflavin-dependent oxidoreductase (nitroreductase family)